MLMFRLLKITPLMLSALVLVGCNASIVSVAVTPTLSPSPTVAKCINPVQLPNKELSQIEVEKYWSQDRVHLILCKKSRKIIEDYYRKRDTELSK